MKHFLLSLTIFLPLLLASPVQAQQLHLSISPILLQATIKPDKSITQVFNIHNLSDSPLTLTPQMVPFSSDNLTGQPQLQPQLQPDWLSYFSLINTNIHLNEPFTLAPQQKEQLVLNISIPSSALSRDRYVTLLLTSPEDSSSSFTSITGGIGSNILLTITPVADPHSLSQITHFQPHSPLLLKIGNTYLLDNLTPVSFTAILKNQGSHLIETHGLFEIARQDHPIHLQSLLPIYTLAYSQRQLLASPSGQFNFIPSLNHLGTYQASLSLRALNSSADSSLNLVFLPIKAGLGLILSLILLYTIIKFNPSPQTNNPQSKTKTFSKNP